MPKNVKIVTLGCPKNEVDSEVLGNGIQRAGFNLVSSEEDADVIIVNTCGFIENAREESIDTILKAGNIKTKGRATELLVAGCLSQRYESELRKELPEVDQFFGVEDFRSILTYLGGTEAAHYARPGRRLLDSKNYYSYLKIAEGCDNECSFCAIPNMRGLQKSRSIDSLLEETEMMVAKGIKELILISQDLTMYGWDLNSNGDKGPRIHNLINELSKTDGIEWIRIMYAHPAHITNELSEIISEQSKVCNYIDMPVQHINDRILKSMKRSSNSVMIRRIISNLRKDNPDIALRTSIIVGYPGETEEEFRELYDFVEETNFDRLGVFTYSHEESTSAGFMVDSVSKELKIERMDQIMLLQQEISEMKNKEMVNEVYSVLIDDYKKDSGVSVGRTYKDAPEVDNIVVLNEKIEPGIIVDVKITSSAVYDVTGELTNSRTS